MVMPRLGLALPALFCFISFLPSGLQAEAPASISLSLNQAIDIAFMNNIDIQVERENIHISRFSYLIEAAQFDASLSFDARSNRTIRSSTSGIETGPSGTDQIVQENQRLSAGLHQRFRWGGDYDLNLGQSRSKASFQTLNPTINGTLIFSFTQPLLNGFGREITEVPLRIAQGQIAVSESAFQTQVMNMILGVGNAYWDLVFQLKNLEVQKQNRESAKQLLDSVRAKVNSGVLAPIEVLVAESGVASLGEAVLIAEKAVRDTEDQLRLLLNFPDQSLGKPPVIQPSEPPIETEKTIDEETVLNWALAQRPELKGNKHLLQNQALSVKRASDLLAPSLDLVGNVGLNGLGSDFSSETDQLTSGSFHQWEAGLVLSFPLGNRSARAALKREKAELSKTALTQQKIAQEIANETKEGIRRVRTDFQRIATTRRARLLAAEKLTAGNERFHLGLISSHDLLEFQDDLAEAKGKELKALTDYNKSLINLEKVTGTLLSRYRIETAEPGAPLQ